jgi:hypothetical protein
MMTKKFALAVFAAGIAAFGALGSARAAPTIVSVSADPGICVAGSDKSYTCSIAASWVATSDGNLYWCTIVIMKPSSKPTCSAAYTFSGADSKSTPLK